MSFYNKDKNPFPFYKLEGTVWTNTKPFWFVNNCKQNCCYDHILFPGAHTFQFPLSDSITNPNEVTEVDLRFVSDNTILVADLDRTILVDSNGKKFLIISIDFAPGIAGNKYYISVVTGFGRYYSEIICLKVQSSDMIHIEWSLEKGKVGNLIYNGNVSNIVNIDAIIIPNQPEIEEQTEEDGYGNEVATLQVLKQSFNFSFMAPNFVAQALSAIPLHDRYNIVNKSIGEINEGYDENIKTIILKVTPENDGCFSLVDFNFTKETIIKTACEDDIIEMLPTLLVFDDQEEDEWNLAGYLAGCTFPESGAHSGVKFIQHPSVFQSSSYMVFQSIIGFAYSETSGLSFWMKHDVPWASSSYIAVSISGGGNSPILTLNTTNALTFGYDIGVFGTWQKVDMSLGDFAYIGDIINQITFTLVNIPPIGFDLIEFSEA